MVPCRILKNRYNRRAKFLSPGPPMQVMKGIHIEPSKSMRVEYQPPYWWETQNKRIQLERHEKNKEFSRKLKDISKRLDRPLRSRTLIRDTSSNLMTTSTTTMPIWKIRIGKYSTSTFTSTLTGEDWRSIPIYITVQVGSSNTYI